MNTNNQLDNISNIINTPLSAHNLVQTFLAKFFSTIRFTLARNIKNTDISQFIADISSAFICLDKDENGKKRLSAKNLFESIKKIFDLCLHS